MKIRALRLFNVRRFAGRGVAIEGIGDGVNVLSAPNEFGKSTSFEALHALFFQPHSGTPGEVQRLRPYSGGNPLVEADVATDQGQFRITKQYYGGRSARVSDLASGRLVAQADEAENFIAELVRGGTSGPAGLLWVRQGITGIEKRTRTEEDNERQVRADLLASVQGEVEAVTGGRRMAEIMSAATEALAELVSATGRPKAGGRYAIALAERDRLAARERSLSEEVTALRQALDTRTAARRRLDEIEAPQDKTKRSLDIQRAQAAFEAARAQGEALKAADAELRLAREMRDGAGRDLKTYRDALARAEALAGGIRQAMETRDAAAGKRRDAQAAIEAAMATLDAREAEEAEARDLLARMDAALRARDAAQQLDALRARLAEAETLRRRIEDGEAALAPLRLSPQAIDDLQALDLEIAKHRAVEAASRPTVTVSYEADAKGTILIDGTPLAEAEERGYEGQARLTVPGIGAILLRSGRRDAGESPLKRTEEARRTLLATMGVADLGAARQRQARAQELESELRALKASLAALAPKGLAALREEIAARDVAHGDETGTTQDRGQVQSALAEAESRRALARNALREAQPLRTGADEAFVAAETKLAELNAELAQVTAVLGAAQEREARHLALQTRRDVAETALASAQAGVEALRAGAVDLASAEAALTRARSIEAAALGEANALRETIAGLNGQIRASSDDAVEEEWRDAAAALATAAARVTAFEREIAILRRLCAALDAARAQARDLYLKPVMAELMPLIELLFDDVSITFDEKSLLPQTILRQGQEEDVERLSGGMREQLAILTRLAFARLLARDGRPAPVILDDALVYSDDDRIERMFDALHRQSRDQQIIVFSCRQRAFARLGGNVLRMEPWSPPK